MSQIKIWGLFQEANPLNYLGSSAEGNPNHPLMQNTQSLFRILLSKVFLLCGKCPCIVYVQQNFAAKYAFALVISELTDDYFEVNLLSTFFLFSVAPTALADPGPYLNNTSYTVHGCDVWLKLRGIFPCGSSFSWCELCGPAVACTLSELIANGMLRLVGCNFFTLCCSLGQHQPVLLTCLGTTAKNLTAKKDLVGGLKKRF